MTQIPSDDPTTRLFLRHTLATLAYRAGKTVRGTPEAFGAFRATSDSPSSVEIVAHMGDLMDWVLRMVQGESKWTSATPLPWKEEIARFFVSLGALDKYLASGTPIRWEPGSVFQGGIADALTHTGQLAMLRRLSGFKMKGESYARADIVVGRVGLDQTPPEPKYEFD
ncbi:MAG: hypothetical protein HY304_03000 [candidate division Zixibacteria bacterium]|nr:hypothetical protein [candidate division Zixibacteria bacterium]